MGSMLEQRWHRDRISELWGRPTAFIQSERLRENKLKYKEQSLEDPWDHNKTLNIRITRVTRRRKSGTERIFRDDNGLNIPKVGKAPKKLKNLNEAQKGYTQNNVYQAHIIIKLLKTKKKK